MHMHSRTHPMLVLATSKRGFALSARLRSSSHGLIVATYNRTRLTPSHLPSSIAECDVHELPASYLGPLELVHRPLLYLTICALTTLSRLMMILPVPTHALGCTRTLHDQSVAMKGAAERQAVEQEIGPLGLMSRSGQRRWRKGIEVNVIGTMKCRLVASRNRALRSTALGGYGPRSWAIACRRVASQGRKWGP